MRAWDLTGNSAKLGEAMHTFQTVASNIADSWSDQAYTNFVETYLEPVEPRVRTTLDAARRLAEVLASAAKQCEDE